MTERIVHEGSTSPVRRTRPHPAHGSRIAAAGVGFASMFGIVAGLGWANRPGTADAAPAAPAAPVAAPQVVIVVHHSNGATTVSSAGAAETGAAGVPAAAPVAAGGVPIPLVAQPTVRVAPAAQPANASTHGSR